MEMAGMASTPSPEPVNSDEARLGTGIQASAGQDAFLSADVGGTYARLALVAGASTGANPRVLSARTYRCADHPHLEDIIRCFCAELDVRPRELVLACAGYLHAGSVITKNLAWSVRPDALKQALALEQVRFFNDLEALAYAVGHNVVGEGAVTLKNRIDDEANEGPIVVIGPGTGLGAAVWLPGEAPRVMATEAGHTQIAARVGIEQQVLTHLAQPNSHVSSEMVLSGPGLHRLYMALCAIRDRYPSHDEPSAITAAAIEGGDDVAREALTLFCGWLGSFAADMAMLYGATGGIYLAGGFLSKIVDFMRSSSLIERFLDKGVMRPFLQRLPIYVMDDAQHGVIGAARWHLDSRVGARVNQGGERSARAGMAGATRLNLKS
jgi:glucokinase